MGLFQTATVHRVLLTLIISLLIYSGYRVLESFLIPAAWAAIFAYVTWPMNIRLRQYLNNRPNSAAALMTLGMALLLIIPLIWIIFVLQDEAALVYDKLSAWFGQRQIVIPPFLHKIPLLGHALQTFIDRLSHDPEALKNQLQQWLHYGFSAAGELASSISHIGAQAGMSLFTLFFFYRDGHDIMAQIRQGLGRLIGDKAILYIHSAGEMTKAMVLGIVLTAFAQGFLAGVGYAVAGVDSPVFLAAITTVIAMIPFGTPFAWGSVAIWLFSQGHIGAALGLAAWGLFVISWIDNIIRPIVISSATQIPFLLVMCGVLGGLNAFGMVGLFIGPVILSVLLAVWRQWLADAPTSLQAS